MSYQVLARKWRPRSFGALVGQSHVVRVLSHALSTQRLHHAFLFTGTRGVGKTTLARLLAKAVNCEQGIQAEPCNVCRACTEIDAGRFVDLIEVDAASRTKVEDMRQLLDNVQYSPTRGRFKVYLIDEVHMLSKHSFNALLKTLEEPPPHVKFILATTDPQKLPVTVLSRCLQFHLRRLDEATLQAHLEHVLKAEGMAFEASALALLARAADGSVRDALSLLDQAIAFGGGEVDTASVADMLGAIAPETVQAVLQALMMHDGNALFAACAQLRELGADAEAFLLELMRALHALSLRQLVPEATVDHPALEPSIALDAESVQLYYQFALCGRRDLAEAPDAYTGLEMTLLRMLCFTLDEPAAAPIAPAAPAAEVPCSPEPARVEAEMRTNPAQHMAEAKAAVRRPRPASKKTAAPPPEDPAPKAHTPPPSWQTSPAEEPPPWLSDAPPEHEGTARHEAVLPPPPSAVSASPSATPPPQPAAVEAAPPVEVSAVDASAALPIVWHDLLPQLELTGMAEQLGRNCAGYQRNGRRIDLMLDARWHNLRNPSAEQRLQDALRTHFAEPQLEVHWQQPDASAGPTPAELQQQQRLARQEAAVRSIQDDAHVKHLCVTFDAEILPDSIRPIDPPHAGEHDPS